MISWSTPALLLLGMALGPYGLSVLSPSMLLLLDPGIAMALAMLGVFVGLSFDLRQPKMARAVGASAARTATTAAAVTAAAAAALAYWLDPGSPAWLFAMMLGVCAAVSDTASDVNIDDVVMIVVGGLIVIGIRAGSPAGVAVVAGVLAAVAVAVAGAAWLLVGQTDSEGEQHVFVVGSLLLVGGAASYLLQSAALAGLLAGLTWNVAGNISKVRITRDLHYFQHPLVVLVLLTAGAAAALSLDALALAVIFAAVRAVARSVGAWLARRLAGGAFPGDAMPSLISAGLVGIALSLDAFRAHGGGEWGPTLLGAVAIGTIASEALAIVVPATGEGR